MIKKKGIPQKLRTKEDKRVINQTLPANKKTIGESTPPLPTADEQANRMKAPKRRRWPW